MSVGIALTSLLGGKNDVCCLCFQDANEDAVNTDEDILLETGNIVNMSDILTSVLGQEILCDLANLGVFCMGCCVSLAQSYHFKNMCEENLNKLKRAAENLQQSFVNTAQGIDCYKTMFLCLNEADLTNTTFYDVTQIKNKTAAYERINYMKLKNSLRHKGVKPEAIKKNILNNSLDFQRDKKNKDVESPYVGKVPNYDIPYIPTTELIFDTNYPMDFTCCCCLKKFINEKALRKHFFKEHYPKNVKCNKCHRKFLTQEHLNYHYNKDHTVVGACRQCGKHFTKKSVLKKHEINHNTRIICHDCGRMYRSKEAFQKHIKDDVCKQKSKKSSKDGDYQCDICKKTYCYKPYLAKHIKYEHGNAKGFICEFCNKQFYTKSKLQSHLVRHTGEKNFVCPLCEGRFVTKESLLYHTRLHTGEKPYQCEYCDQAFLSASRRIDHVRRHHLEPSLECDICHHKFKASMSLRKHRIKHFNPQSRLYKEASFRDMTVKTQEYC